MYDVVQDKWIVMNSSKCKLSEFPGGTPSMVNTKNEEYVIITYLHVKFYKWLSVYNKIEIFGIANNRIIPCAIKPPFRSNFESIRQILH